MGRGERKIYELSIFLLPPMGEECTPSLRILNSPGPKNPYQVFWIPLPGFFLGESSDFEPSSIFVVGEIDFLAK